MYSRFERLNRLTESQQFGHWENREGKRFFQTELPLEYQKGLVRNVSIIVIMQWMLS